jgi:hypothetical protein
VPSWHSAIAPDGCGWPAPQVAVPSSMVAWSTQVPMSLGSGAEEDGGGGAVVVG